MEYQNILFAVRNQIAYLTLNRPRAMNALCDALNDEVEDALLQVERRQDIRALILTGGPKVFAAGADLVEMAQATAAQAEATSRKGHRVNNRLESLPVPVIAAINGPALGGGMELALACDFRVVGEGALFGLPEVSLGILPGAGGTQRLTALAGPAVAKELVLLGKKVRGTDAKALGLATVVAADDQVMAEAERLAEKLKAMPAYALHLAKSAIQSGQDRGLSVGKETEQHLFGLAFASADQREGMQAFLEKRPAQYTHVR